MVSKTGFGAELTSNAINLSFRAEQFQIGLAAIDKSDRFISNSGTNSTGIFSEPTGSNNSS